MIRVYKFKLSLFDPLVRMQKNANIIHIGEQSGDLYLWAECPISSSEMESRYFTILGTGHDKPNGQLKHIGTVQMKDSFVWHVYENVEVQSQFIQPD